MKTRYYTWRNININVAIYRNDWHFKMRIFKSIKGCTMWMRFGPLWVGAFIAACVKVKK